MHCAKRKRPNLSKGASLLVGKRDLNRRPQDYESDKVMSTEQATTN
jgi:hypothetical protein